MYKMWLNLFWTLQQNRLNLRGHLCRNKRAAARPNCRSLCKVGQRHLGPKSTLERPHIYISNGMDADGEVQQSTRLTLWSLADNLTLAKGYLPLRCG